MKVDSSSAILISPKDYAILWKIKLASHPVCVCVSECVCGCGCVPVWVHRETVLMPGVCFIFSGLCLLLPGAVECTALGGRLQGREAGEAGQPVAVSACFLKKRLTLCLCLASFFEEDVFKG